MELAETDQPDLATEPANASQPEPTIDVEPAIDFEPDDFVTITKAKPISESQPPSPEVKSQLPSASQMPSPYRSPSGKPKEAGLSSTEKRRAGAEKPRAAKPRLLPSQSEGRIGSIGSVMAAGFTVEKSSEKGSEKVSK